MFKHLWICWFDAMIVFSLIPFFGYETHHQMLKTCTSSIRCSRSNTHLLLLLLKSFTNDKINLHFIISCLIVDPFLISNRTELSQTGKNLCQTSKEKNFPDVLDRCGLPAVNGSDQRCRCAAGTASQPSGTQSDALAVILLSGWI